MSHAISIPLATDPLQPSASFKSEAIKAIFAIVAFIIVYILLFILALALAAACMYFGISLIIASPSLYSIIIGGGLIGVGVMVFIFLVKFLFESTKVDMSDSIPITKEDQPKLVEFIHSIADETKTSKPKKIYISHDVNASVFYNSSFWSMFLPVKKNLNIGLGLVNALNISEFKAVIAHEFGHFSQRSMKLGSFVYNVNHIIFNMLFKNSSYGKTLQTWASGHFIFYIFAKITAFIVQGIQWVLRQMYKLVNVSYMGLSRQMEFHADLVSSSVSGSNNIISSLKRLEVADTCFNATINTYNKLLKENKRGINLYDDHRSVFQHFASVNNFQLESGLPLLALDFQNSDHQRVNIKDQWASHPSTQERKANLDNYDLSGPVDHTSAWSLIENAEALKLQVTNNIYKEVVDIQSKTAVDNFTFDDYYKNNAQRASLPSVFNKYYDSRYVERFDLTSAKDLTVSSFTEHFSEDTQQLPVLIDALNNDIALLKAIEAKQVDTRTFDFNGNKYTRTDAVIVCATLEAELQEKNQALKMADKQLYALFYKQSLLMSNEAAKSFEAQYAGYFDLKERSDAYLNTLQEVLGLLEGVFSGEAMECDAITIIIADFKNNLERKLKAGLREWIIAGAFDNDPDIRMKVKAFVNKELIYFSETAYFDQDIADVSEVIHEGWDTIQQFVFEKYKAILEAQAIMAVRG